MFTENSLQKIAFYASWHLEKSVARGPHPESSVHICGIFVKICEFKTIFTPF